VGLYRDGLIYRGKRLVNWDPKAHTTVSDAEVEHEERDGTLWRVRYPLTMLNELPAEFPGLSELPGIEVATTRPETMLGDAAIAVHPDDKRYRDLIGKSVLVPPLLQRKIPIIADESVDPEFGTGAVKVTPAHDATDYEIGLRHKLPMPSVIDPSGMIIADEIAVGRFAGMPALKDRGEIACQIDAPQPLIEKKPYKHRVVITERSGAGVEPASGRTSVPPGPS